MSAAYVSRSRVSVFVSEKTENVGAAAKYMKKSKTFVNKWVKTLCRHKKR